jgi:hypothetical protein
VSKLPLQHFSAENGADFLLWQLNMNTPNDTEKDDAREISKLVDGLPLFLTHIGGHIAHSQSSLHEYLMLFHKSSDIWQDRHGSANWMYERAISAVFDVALAELSSEARHLVYVLAFLSPDGVPEKLLFPEDSSLRLEYIGCFDQRA